MNNKNIAYVFPGQGSQYVGMGNDICELYPEARSVFEQASDALGVDLKRLCFQDPKEKLRLTTHTQPAILTTSLAIWASLGNPKSVFFAGHSLGEFTALVAGGALDLKTGVLLVRDRGRFMQEAVPPDEGGMAAIIGLDNKVVQEICMGAWRVGHVWPANYNCPGQIVISGERKGVIEAIELAKQKGAKRSVMLEVSIPSHCPLMEGAAIKLAETLEDVELKDLKTPVVSNTWATPVTEKDKIKENILLQLTSSVRWEDCIRFMINEGVKTIVEVGPGRILTGLIKRIDKDIRAMNVSDVTDVERFMEAIQ